MFLRSYLIYPLGPRALMHVSRGIWLTASACVSRSSQVAGLRAVAQGGLEVRTRLVRTPEPYVLVVGGGGRPLGFRAQAAPRGRAGDAAMLDDGKEAELQRRQPPQVC